MSQGFVEASTWRQLLRSHPTSDILKSSADHSRLYILVDTSRGERDRMSLRGITSDLNMEFFENFRWKSSKSSASALPLPKALRGITSVQRKKMGSGSGGAKPPKQKKKLTTRARRLEALDRGTTVHRQIGYYFTQLAIAPHGAKQALDSWLLAEDQSLHPATLQLVNALVSQRISGRPNLQRFFPVYSEFVVCDMPRVSDTVAQCLAFDFKMLQLARNSSGKEARVAAAAKFVIPQLPRATPIDALMYDAELRRLVMIEFKTTTGLFDDPLAKPMKPPLQRYPNSLLWHAKIQLALGMEMARRSYPDLIGRDRIYGIVAVANDSDPSAVRVQLYPLFFDEVAPLIEIFESIGWLERL